MVEVQWEIKVKRKQIDSNSNNTNGSENQIAASKLDSSSKDPSINPTIRLAHVVVMLFLPLVTLPSP